MIKKAIRKLSEYPRLRVLLVIAVIIIVIVMVFELFTPKSQNVQVPPIPGSQIQNQNLNINSHPTEIGTATRELQAKQIQNQNLEHKVSSGADVFMSGLFGQGDAVSSNNAGDSNNTGIVKSPEQVMQESGGNSANGSSASQSGPAPVLSPSQLEKAMNNPQGRNYAQNNYPGNNDSQGGVGANYASQQIESTMRSTIQNYSSQWNLPTQSKVVGSDQAETNGPGGSGGLPALPATNMIKAGTIMFAVLENGLSSDQTGTPVLAEIATGKYRGAELIGSFTKSSDDKLVIQFSRMVLKDLPNTVSINAYAIDPETAENAVASGVDHHYLERYGSLFAASLLQGFGNAYSNYQNPCYGTNNCFIDGNVQKADVTTKTAMYQGLGQIGTNVASQVQNNFNRPDTVYVKQGSGLGILFMDNVTDQSAGAVPATAMIGNPAALKTFANTSDTGVSNLGTNSNLSSGQ